MTQFRIPLASAVVAALLLCSAVTAHAHKLRERGEAVTVANSAITIVPARHWNRLSKKLGKNAETWTLDGEQLNDVTFFGAIGNGNPLFKEIDKKEQPLPRFSGEMLLIEVPEFLERTYRAYKQIGSFDLVSTEPGHFLGQDGVVFTYRFTDRDELTRQGEAYATIIDGELFMATFDAPRLNYFDKSVDDFRALVSSASLPGK